MAFRGPRVWLWRWRRNPLKRRADVVEAWVVLGVWALTVLAGVLAGLGAARTVEHGLARERVEWRPVVAYLTEQAPGTAATHSRTPSGDQVWAEVRWTVPDGSARTGQARVDPGSSPGTPVTIWTDPRGTLVTRPATAAQARLRAALTGGLIGVGAGTLPFVGGRVLRGRLERGRMEQWDAEWARLGPLWGRTTG
ncbi:Rv1733c family protein [Streptomyces sp. NPDC003011]